ncbi:MAG: alpha-2-macroglobulin family protein, partial [Verrucomicrobiota bacterium]
ELELSDEGKANVALDYVPTGALESPVRVEFGVDVTDINQQTISKSTSVFVHSSDYYLGLKLPSGWLNTGDEFKIEALPATRDSQKLDREVEATLTVERQEWTTVKVEAAGGEVRHRNEWVYKPHSEQTIKLGPEVVAASLQFEDPGTYRFTLEAEENGKTIRTVGTRYIYGSGDQWWAHRDGEKIELVVEDDITYKPGDTAKILVRSPVLGTALVTTERAGVHTSFLTELTSKSQFIDISISKRDAPNLFVSVVIIRGANDSPHEFKDADYKLGYTELKVERADTKLDVKVEVAENDIRPQDEVNLTATVTGNDGEPLSGAEVTLYAVDEGVLSLTGYQTPNPGPRFHRPYPLYVKTWHSLFNVLPEDVQERYFQNKGLLIGGGGSLDMLQQNARKDFRATAFWNGSLLTDENGQVKAQFKAPDNLTEYRIIAVALGGTEAYGSGVGKMTVTKPVIVEPALPAFANVGDDFLLQAVVHNTTGQPGRFEVTMKLDEHAEFHEEEFKIIPAAIVADDPTLWRETVELAAGESRGLPIPIHIKEVGTAKWVWTIEELQAQGKARTDSIETTLDIGYPVPLLGETHHLNIKRGSDGNLLASFGKDILHGIGEIDVTISNSRLLEAKDALGYNLRYPYGCVEQTTSATLPWLTMEKLEGVFPDLDIDAEKKQVAIDKGLSRLLSMQTYDGGLSYWPGNDEPIMWASAYGGLALTLGAKQGHAVSQTRLDMLYQWMSENLRIEEGDEITTREFHNRAMALYTLALGGKAEPAYHELLYKRRGELAPESRAFVAMAILEAGTPEQKQLVPELLVDFRKEPEAVHWYGSSIRVSSRLIAWTHLDPKSKKVNDHIDELMKLRRPQYGWGSTFTNAWPLLALSKVAELQGIPDNPIQATLAFGQDEADVSLGAGLSSADAKFGYDGDIRQQLLELTAGGRDQLHAHVQVKAYPSEISAEPQDQGFKIRRGYHRLNPDGSMEQTDNFAIGDLVVVHLEVDIENPDEYLAIDDPLPAVFEAVNPAFETQANVDAPMNRWEQLPRNFEEIRSDRALFFSNHVWNAGKYRVQYLARVVAAGSVTAPPAKIEAMYEPQRRGLSATRRITATIPQRAADKPVALAR